MFIYAYKIHVLSLKIAAVSSETFARWSQWSLWGLRLPLVTGGKTWSFCVRLSGGGRLTSHQFLFFGGGFNGNYLRSSPLFVVWGGGKWKLKLWSLSQKVKEPFIYSCIYSIHSAHLFFFCDRMNQRIYTKWAPVMSRVLTPLIGFITLVIHF